MPSKRRTKFNKTKIILLLSPLLLAIGYYVYKEIKSNRIKYKNFGVSVPDRYDIYGIDVSKYQGYVNWNSVRKMNIEGIKINFAFIKATQGMTTIDLNYLQNIIRARHADMPVGSYHFFLTYRDAETQANNFARVASVKKGDLPPVLDVEEAKGVSDEKIRKGVKIWLRLIEKKYKVRPILYTNAGFYKRYLAGHFEDYPLWIAHYKNGDAPEIDRHWSFWQLSEKSKINGITGYVDFNAFYGTAEDFEDLIIK